jgi:dihydrofolate reductase
MELTAIAAVARNGVIGARGAMPWHVPEDFRRFKRVTMGGVLIMGRATFDAVGELPGRQTIVITRSPRLLGLVSETNSDGNGVDVSYVSSLAQALLLANGTGRQVFIAGGAQIYRLAWPQLTRLDITEIDAEPAGDAFFPVISADEWREVSRDPHDGFSFVTYARR